MPSTWQTRSLSVVALLFCLLRPLPAQNTHPRIGVQAGDSKALGSAISPDGRFLATANEDGTARLWELSTGREIRRFGSRMLQVFSVAFSADGAWLLSGGQEDEVNLWETNTGKLVRKFSTEFTGKDRTILSVAFSADQREVVARTFDGAAHIWETATGKEVRVISPNKGLNAVALSPDGRVLVIGADDGLQAWDTATWQPIRRFNYSEQVESVAFSPDGNLLLTGSGDARLWEVATGRPIRDFAAGSPGVVSLAFSAGARFLATGGVDGSVRVWETATAKQLQLIKGHDASMRNLAFTPEDAYVVSSAYDGAVVLWDTASGKEIRRFRNQSAGLSSAKFSADGRFILTGGWDGMAHLWGTGLDDAAAPSHELHRLPGANGAVFDVAFSPDGRTVVTANRETTAHLWRSDTGEETGRVGGHVPGVWGVAISPDGRYVVTSGNDGATLSDAATGTDIRSFRADDSVEHVAFSPDGQFLLTTTENGAYLWDVKTGTKIRSFKNNLFKMVGGTFSADGRHILTGAWYGAASLWETATGKEVHRFETGEGANSGDGVKCVAFSPDGRYVVTGEFHGAIRFWDIDSRKEVRRFLGHSADPTSLAFSPDGRFLLSGSDDGTSRVWDIVTGRWLVTLISFSSGGWAVVDADNRYDASDPIHLEELYWILDGPEVSATETVGLDQLKSRYYTPGLLGRILRGEKLEPVVAEIPPLPSVRAGAVENVSIAVTVTNHGGGIGRLMVKVNGVELESAGDAQRIDPSAPSATIRVNLQGALLRPDGHNQVEVAAYDAGNWIHSRGVKVHWETSRIENNRPKLLALIAGVSRYASPDLNLSYSSADAMMMADAIQRAAGNLYGKDQVIMHLLATGGAHDPSKAEFESALNNIASIAAPGDTLIIYLAGHAVAARDAMGQHVYYFLTSDAHTLDTSDRLALSATTLSSEDLRRAIERIQATHRIIILDTCAAGAAQTELAMLTVKRALPDDQIRALIDLQDRTGLFMLMGSAADSASYEASRYGHGVLTYSLLDGLRGAAVKDQNRVNVSDWFEVARDEVPRLARYVQGIQRPEVFRGGDNFPIGLMTEEDKRAIVLPSPKPQLLQARCRNEVDTLGLEVAVRAELRRVSTPVTRGSQVSEPAIVYLDNVSSGFPGSLSPRFLYVKHEGSYEIQFTLVRDEKVVFRATWPLDSREPVAMARALVENLLAGLAKLE